METQVTVFSVKDTEVELEGDPDDPTSLPAYSDATTSKLTRSAQTPMLELGARWTTLHYLLGDWGPGHPLAFLASGGAPVPALDDGRHSSGRFFAPATTAEISGALAAASDREIAARVGTTPVGAHKLTTVDAIRLIDRLRAFVAEAVQNGRGVVVHRFV